MFVPKDLLIAVLVWFSFTIKLFIGPEKLDNFYIITKKEVAYYKVKKQKISVKVLENIWDLRCLFTIFGTSCSLNILESSYSLICVLWTKG